MRADDERDTRDNGSSRLQRPKIRASAAAPLSGPAEKPPSVSLITLN